MLTKRRHCRASSCRTGIARAHQTHSPGALAAALLAVSLLLPACWTDEPQPVDLSGLGGAGQGGGGGYGAGQLGWTSGTGSLSEVWLNFIRCTGTVTQSSFKSLDVDAEGSALLGGWLDGECTLFGPGPVVTAGQDIITARLGSVAGLPQWTGSYGDGSDQALDRTAGGPLGLVLGGRVAGTLDLGSGVLLIEFPSGDQPHGSLFVAGLDVYGDAQWGRVFDVNAYYVDLHVSSNVAGEVLLGGGPAIDEVDFGGGLLPANMSGFYLAKLDAVGGHLWSHVLGPTPPSGAALRALALTSSGDVLLAGELRGQLVLPGGQLDSGGEDALFLAKLDSAGTHLWSTVIAISDACNLQMVTHASGSVSLGAVCIGTVDFGEGPNGQLGQRALHLARFALDGSLLWSRTWPTEHADRVRLAPAPNDAVILAADFQPSIDFGDGVLPSAGRRDLAIAEIAAGGETVWSQRFGDEWDQSADAIAVSNAGSVLVLGNGLESEPDTVTPGYDVAQVLQLAP
jgi:hypothetical protein